LTHQTFRKVPYTRPSITELEVGYATDATRFGWGDHCYDYIHRFEEAFKQYLGVSYAIATSSCTGALHLGMHALGIGPGDEVILAETNWVATLAPILHLGATPVFVDILPDTWCLDPRKVEAAVTPKTKAIVAVHLYGNLCDMEALLAIGSAHGIPVIEDAAEAIGSIWKGKRAGSLGRFGAFSFHGTKTMTTGEGGIFVTNDPSLYDSVLTLSNHGRDRRQTRQFWPDMLGYKFKMSNVQAAIGCGQLERVDELITRKRDILCFYRQAFAGVFGDSVRLNPDGVDGTQIGAWMPTIVFSDDWLESIEPLKNGLVDRGIDARVVFHPLSMVCSSWPQCNATKPLAGSEVNMQALSFSRHALNLPSFHDMDEEDQLHVVNSISQILGKA
jgi:perosamine synthetase